MGGLLTGAAVAETMSLTGSAAATAQGWSALGALSASGAAIGDALGSFGTYTVAIGTYTITAPVVLLMTLAVLAGGVMSAYAARRFRVGRGETQSLLRGGAYGTTAGRDNMV